MLLLLSLSTLGISALLICTELTIPSSPIPFNQSALSYLPGLLSCIARCWMLILDRGWSLLYVDWHYCASMVSTCTCTQLLPSHGLGHEALLRFVAMEPASIRSSCASLFEWVRRRERREVTNLVDSRQSFLGNNDFVSDSKNVWRGHKMAREWRHRSSQSSGIYEFSTSPYMTLAVLIRVVYLRLLFLFQPFLDVWMLLRFIFFSLSRFCWRIGVCFSFYWKCCLDFLSGMNSEGCTFWQMVERETEREEEEEYSSLHVHRRFREVREGEWGRDDGKWEMMALQEIPRT